MTISSRRLFIYLQRPDDGRWVTVGRYSRDKATEAGTFRYAPSYLASSATWSIDPVNLPLNSFEFSATRYGGLHDVLRDTCPDAWGQALIRRRYQLSEAAPPVAYLLHAGNGDRWGALAVGMTAKPNVGHLASPKLTQVEVLSQELLAMFAHRPAVDPGLRKRLLSTPSLGGARPKATVRDGSYYWLVKPRLPSDVHNVAKLEFAAGQWALAAGLDFAATRYWSPDDGYMAAVMSQRFDRHAITGRRLMAVSAASLLQTEYPAHAGSPSWSYPILAQVLGQIGAPKQDRIELFSRMIFNAVTGNDDDHPRNTAIVHDGKSGTWRLAPAFDVVPNLDFQPDRLSMQVCAGHFDFSHGNVLVDAKAFGFDDEAHGKNHLQDLLARICNAFDATAHLFDADVRDTLYTRLRQSSARLGINAQ